MLIGLGDALVDSIAQAIYAMEGSGPTTIATRNNNPGNLRSGPGQTGSSGGYAVFPDMATGWEALNNQISLNIARGLTLYEFFGGKPGVYAGYAPSADSNNPIAYANFVAGRTGIDPNVPLNSIGSSSTTIDASGGFYGTFTPPPASGTPDPTDNPIDGMLAVPIDVTGGSIFGSAGSGNTMMYVGLAVAAVLGLVLIGGHR